MERGLHISKILQKRTTKQPISMCWPTLNKRSVIIAPNCSQILWNLWLITEEGSVITTAQQACLLFPPSIGLPACLSACLACLSVCLTPPADQKHSLQACRTSSAKNNVYAADYLSPPPPHESVCQSIAALCCVCGPPPWAGRFICVPMSWNLTYIFIDVRERA